MIRVFSFNYPPKKIYMKPENLQELVCFKLTMIITCKSNIEDFIKAFCLTKKDDQRSTRVLPVYYQRTPSVLPVTTSVLPALLQRLHPPHAPQDNIHRNQHLSTIKAKTVMLKLGPPRCLGLKPANRP